MFSESAYPKLVLLSLIALGALLLGGRDALFHTSASATSDDVIVHAPVTPKVFSGSVRALPVVAGGRRSTVPEGQTSADPPLAVPPRAVADPVLQSSLTDGDGFTDGHGQLSAPIVSFDGIAGFSPADPTGDVGPNHYVQMINSAFQIWNKLGQNPVGPTNINLLWANAGDTTECATTNDGDPIVLYDHLADRWLLSQFDATGPNTGMCIAISRTPDPTGQYFLYRFLIPAAQTDFPDYPKFGVWPDGYYMSSYEAPVGLGVYVFERSMMLTGNPARVVEYTKPSQLNAPAGFRDTRLLPAELDGPLPPAGSPNYFIRTAEDVQDGADRIDIYEVAVNWGDPLTSSINLVQSLNTAAFSFFSCANDALGAPRLCIDQPNTANQIDALMGRPMWRMQYRNFGGHEVLVFNQTVDAGAGTANAGNTGIRWYELRRTTPGSGNWAINQQGTYAPQVGGVNSTTWVQRWMGSAAMDKAGNIALGYNVVNDDDTNPVFPGIRYTGRLASDPAGILPQGEETIINGGGSSTNSNRWGDYTHLAVDPADDCTFWYTAEYFANTNAHRTRIASFRFPSCSATDLEIAKSDSPDPVIAGNILTYTVSVTNNGPNNATNVVVTDVLPAAVEYLADSLVAPDNCVEGPVDTLTCTLGSIASGASKSFTIQVLVPADLLSSLGVTTTNISNTASVTSDQADTNAANNSVTISTNVRESADLAVTKVCKPDESGPAGSTAHCDIIVDNLGPSDAQDVVLTDQITSSAPFTVTSISVNPSGTCLPATPIGPVTNVTITCNLGVEPAGGRTTITVNVTSAGGNDINDVASVASSTPDPNTANNSASGQIHFDAAADLSVTKTASPSPVNAGTNLTYNITVSNAGPSVAQNVVVNDVLSGHVTFVSATPSQGSCLSGVVPGDPAKPLTCNLGSLASSGAATIAIVVGVKANVPDGTLLVNNVEVHSDVADPDNSDNVLTITTPVQTRADLGITKTSDADTYKPNSTIRFRVVVTNSGPSDAQNVVVTDALPDDKQAIYLSDTGGCIFSAPKTLVCNLGTLASGGSKEFFINMNVKGAQGAITNTATVTSSTTDPGPTPNTASKTVTVQGGKP